MTTTSYPAVGDDGFDEDEWSSYFAGEDGIMNDFSGTSLVLTRINVGEIARYSPGKVRIGGYILDVTADHDLTVDTAAATYYTWACYDPALNVADGGGDADPDGPCYLGISSGLPSTAGGKQYVIIDKIVRAASQALTATTRTGYRRFVSTAVEMALARPIEACESDYPRGTVRYDKTSNQLYVRTTNAASDGLEWVAVGGDSTSAAIAFPASAGLVAFDVAPQYIKEGNWVHLRGNLKRAAGGNLNTGSTVILGTLPDGSRPLAAHRFMCQGGAGGMAVGVSVTPTGSVTMSDPYSTVNATYISLDGVSFRTV
jgi:hypothetical protein